MRAFFDSNVLVYAFSLDHRSERARWLLVGGGVISIQSLNEFANVARRKLCMSWGEVRAALREIEGWCEIGSVVDLSWHREGLMVSERYQVGLYDALIVAAALRSECDTLWSEDLQDGLVIERRLTIRNPFAG